MARLVNTRTGSVVVIPDEKAERLTLLGYVLEDVTASPAKKAAAKKAPAKKAAASKSE